MPVTAPNAATANFALVPGGSIAGTITDGATSTGISGVTVSIFTSAGNSLTSATTNGAGAYSITGLPAGSDFVRTTNSAGFVDQLFSGIACPLTNCTFATGTPVVVAALATSIADFSLGLGGSISGTVTNAATASVLPSVSVGLFNSGGTQLSSATTNASGTYLFKGLPTGTYFLRATTSLGLVDQLFNNINCVNANCTTTSGTPVTVTAANATTSIDFALAPGAGLSGTVVDMTANVPALGVTVSAYSSTGTFVKSGTTNSSGAYTITGLVPGAYFLRTSNGAGLIDKLFDNIPCPNVSCSVTAGLAVSLTAGNTATGLDFQLVHGGSITGTVTNASTSAVAAGVTVTIFSSAGTSLASSTTNAFGVYTVSGLGTGSYFARTSNSVGLIDQLYNGIVCLKSTCAATTGAPIAVSSPNLTSGIDFALAPGGSIGGTTTNASTGAPVSGVSVSVFSSAGASLTTVTTNASGVYTASGLTAGSYFVRTSNALGLVDQLFGNITCLKSSCTVTTGTPVAVTVPNATTADFALAPGGAISGSVMNLATGALVPGVTVNFFSSAGTSLGAVTTNTAGLYTFIGLTAGSYYARTSNSLGLLDRLFTNVACPGGSCIVTTGTAIAVTAPNTTSGINFALAPGGSLTGTVTNASTGLPVSGVTVSIFTITGSLQATAITNTSGIYAVRGLVTGTYFARTSNAPGFTDQLFNGLACVASNCTVTTGTPILVTVPNVTSGINFALAPAASITGVVTNAATSAPVSGVTVSLFTSAGASAGTGTSNAVGVYTVSGLTTGSYFARTSNALGLVDQLYAGITCTKGVCTATTGTPIAATSPNTTSGVNFALAPGGSITGTVTNTSTSAPAAGVSVTILSSTGTSLTTVTTNASGVYTANGLATGTYFARTSNSLGLIDQLYANIGCAGSLCTATTGTPISVTAPGTTTADFALSPGGSVIGTVTNASTSAPVASVTVSVYNGAGSLVRSATTSALGAYAVTGLPTGTYFARTSNSAGLLDQLFGGAACGVSGCTPTSGTPIVVTAPNATSGIDFTLAPGGSVTGIITNAATSAPLKDVTVFALNSAGIGLGVSTNAQGIYTVTGLATGNYFVRTSNGQGFVDQLTQGSRAPVGCARLRAARPSR